MYKVYHKVAIIILSLFFLFIFNSCRNIFEDSVEEVSETRTEQTTCTTTSTPASSTPAPAVTQKITFGGSLQVEGALPSKLQQALNNPDDVENDLLETEASRSARPTLGSGSNYQYYVRAYTIDAADDVIVIPVENATTHQFEYTLELELEHTWYFEAGFKRLASGTPGEADYQAERKLLIDYDSKINNPFSIDLHSGSEDGYGCSGHVFVLCPYQSADGKGCINLEINIENNAANSIKLKAYNGNGLLVDWGDAASKVHVVEESGKWYIRSDGVDTSNLDASTFDVKSDTYDLTIMFYKNYTLDSNHDIDLPVFTSYQTINVFDNLTTDTWLNENATISGSSQVINRASDTDPFTFKLTTALVTEAAQTTYYVGLPDIVKSQVTDPETYLAANDNYTGAPYAPFATLTRAFNKIQAQGSSGKNYTIYVSGNQNGNFTIPAALTTDNATSIELKTPESNSSVAVLNGGNNGTVLNVASSVPVKISKLQITNGSAENGGGLYIDSDANVTLGNGAIVGKSGVNSAASSASACGNYASTAGAGIYCKGQLTLKSGSLISYNYVADSDANQQGGGGIYCEGGTVTFESGAKVSYNGAHTQGGGICLYSGTVNMTAGEISNNTGNAVCIRGDLPDGTTYAFNLGGSAKIPYGVSGVTGEGNNDVCLSSNKYISLQSNLSQHDHDNNPLAIKTSQFKRGTQVLSLANADLINSNGNKFIINNDSEWKVVNTNNSDELTKGFIDTEFIYVGSSNKISGSGIEAPDSSDKRGTKAKPYATIKEAVNQCWSTQRDFTIKISGQIGNTSSAEEIPAAFSSASYKQGLAASITIEGANSDNTKDIISRGLTQLTKTNKGSALIIENTAPITLKNLKITGGATTEYGGGIFMGDFKLLTVTLGEGVLVDGNYAAKDGGGIHVKGNYDNPSKLIMTSNARVCNNTAGRQGGGVDLVNANLYMSGNAIIGQKVSGTELSDTAANSEENSSNFSGDVSYGGGGVSCDQYVNVYLGYASDGTTTTGYELADDAGILYNYAIGKGGGVYLSGKKAYLFVSSGSISNNASYHEGGGVYLNSTESTDPLTMNGGYISKNNGREGGGIYAKNGTLKITNGSMSANTATDNGGAVYISSNGAFKIQGDANLYTNTNTLKTNDVYLASGKTIEITNNLNKDNVATLTPGVSTWTRGSTQILSGSEYIETNKNKFKISDPDWKVESKTSDSTTIGVIDADIWVASTEDGETTTRSPGVGKGNDNNRGTKSQPYATLSKAVAACWDTSKNKNFTIYIDGTVTGSQQIGNSASSSSAGVINAKQLTLQGYIPEGATASTATLDGNSGTSTSIRTLVINASRNASNGESIIIKNLKITGGNNTTSGGQGGGIYLKNGIVHLADGAVVAGNKAYYGGGVYTNSGTKLYIHGKAMIGDILEYTADSGNIVVGGTSYPGNTNYASFNGGGIYNDGSLYIGMSTDTGGDYLDSGYGIFRNYAATNGGGIYNNGYFKSRGDISYNGCGEEGGAVFLNANATFACGTLKANKSGVNGGALSVNSAKTATLEGDTSKPLTLTENYIEKSVASGANESTVSGGAVYNQGTLEITGPAKMKDNYIKVGCSSSGATVNAKGGAIYNGGTVNITSETATEFTDNYVEVVDESNGGHAYAYGGAVYQAGTFNISNKANLYDANASEKQNDVYLASGETLTVAGTLSEDHVAVITPNSWTRGRQILGISGVTVTDEQLTSLGQKFSLSEAGWDKENVSTTGVKINSPIYVAGASDRVICYAPPASGANGTKVKPYATIADALGDSDLAGTSYTITVDGKLGAQTIGSGATLPSGGAITVKGYDANAKIDGGGNARALLLSKSGLTTTIKDLKITNGKNTEGAGIKVENGILKLTDGAIVTGNDGSGGNGGGVYVASGASLFMYGKALIGDNAKSTTTATNTSSSTYANKAKNGAGIYNYGGSVYLGYSAAGSESSLTSNDTDGYFGVSRNYATESGGGIYHAYGTLQIASGNVSYNQSATSGGAVYFDYVTGSDSDTTLSAGSVKGNKSGQGGALYIKSSKSVTVSGAMAINGNTATSRGGAVYNKGTFKITGSSTFNDNTASSTTADVYGGALYNCPSCVLEITGSAEIKNNTASTTKSGCSAYGGAIMNDQGSITMSAGTIGASGALNSLPANTGTSRYGGAIYQNGTFTVSGSAFIYPGSENSNDVYLKGNKTITLGTTSLSAYTGSDKMIITPEVWKRGSTFLGGTNVAGNYSKFKCSDSDWSVVQSSSVGVFDTGTTIYVSESAISGVTGGVAGDDTTGRGTQKYPYATIQKAATETWKAQAYTISVNGTLTATKTTSTTGKGNLQNIPNDSTNVKATSIALTGTNSATINGNSKGTALTVSKAIPVTITNLKITGGSATNGGGINIAAGTVKLGAGAVVTGNTASSYGGGVYVASGTSLFMYGTAIIGDSITATADSDTLTTSGTTGCANAAGTSGGGIYSKGNVYLGYTASGSTNSLSGGVCRNYAKANGGYGGGIYSEGTLYANSGNVSYNSNPNNGGGIYFVGTTNEITGALTMTKNSATAGGGAISVASGKTLNISGAASFTENSSNNGGAIINNGILNITANATFTTNTAVNAGGGIHNTGTLTLSNGTFTGNKVTGATGKGGAIYQQGTLNMSGAPNMEDEDHSEKINDIYLPSGKKVYVTATITSFVPGYITPYSWPQNGSTVSVLEGPGLSSAYDRFRASRDDYHISDSGNL